MCSSSRRCGVWNNVALCTVTTQSVARRTIPDQDGLTNSNSYVKAKAWRGIHGGMAATLWNPTAKEQPVTLSGDGHQEIFVVLPPEEATAVLLYAP